MRNLQRIGIVILVCAVIQSSLFAQQTAEKTMKDAWANIYPAIEAQIKAPVFQAKEYNILKFGAKANKPEFLNTKAINRFGFLCGFEFGDGGNY